MANYDYKIAAGHNNAAGLTLVDTIADGNSDTFYMPQSLGTYSKGQQTIGADGGVIFTGFESLTWNMVMNSTQYDYWRTTYASGGYSGNVTIRTVTTQYNSYANYNAVMIIPQVVDVERTNDVFTVAIRMTRLEAL